MESWQNILGKVRLGTFQIGLASVFLARWKEGSVLISMRIVFRYALVRALQIVCSLIPCQKNIISSGYLKRVRDNSAHLFRIEV